jgi:hypothetical protein
MNVERYISVVQRRHFGMDASVAHLYDMVEPLFMIDTHMTFDERIGLMTLAWQLPEGFVSCELGSYLGASTAFLAAMASVKGGHVHAVDTWQNDAMGIEPAEDTFERFRQNTKPFAHVITVHRGRAEDLAQEVPALDALFVDADHSYEGVTRNLADYAGKIKAGGRLALHDWDREEVRRAVGDYFGPGALTPVSSVDSLAVYAVKGRD